jgi:Flp pilus assembly protein TadG
VAIWRMSAFCQRASRTVVPRRFLLSEHGATAVEFALIAPLFLALLLAIFETAIVLLMQQVLQTATTTASRQILTGQAQSQGTTAAQFKQLVCNSATSLFNCGNMYVNVQTFASFSSATMLNPVQNGTFNSGSMSYNIGSPGSIEVVQVFYQWPVYLGPLGFNLSNMNGNIHLLVATAAFRNEP